MAMRQMLLTAPGLAPRRKSVAHHFFKCSSLAALGARESQPTGPPHCRSVSSMMRSHSARVGAQR